MYNPIPQSDFIMKDFKISTYDSSLISPEYKNINITLLDITHSTLRENNRNINFISNPITLDSSSGIPKPNKFIKKNDCMCFWLNINKCVGISELFNKIIAPIDCMCLDRINEHKNSWGFVKYDDHRGKIKKGEVTTKPFENLNYLPMQKIFGNNKSNSPNIGIKINLDTLANPFVDQNNIDSEKTIYTAVFIVTNETKNLPIKQRKLKRTPETFYNLEELRKLFHSGCTCQFNIEVGKFWISKNLSADNKYNCGIILKCTQIFILDDHAWYNPILYDTIENPDSEEYDGKYGDIRSAPKKLII